MRHPKQLILSSTNADGVKPFSFLKGNCTQFLKLGYVDPISIELMLLENSDPS